MQLLRKISTATVFGGKGNVLDIVMKDRNTAHPLYRVVGIANGTREGKSKFDDRPDAQDWRALLGQFEATNLITGEVYRSGVCFMPGYVVDTVAGQFGGDVENIKFAFDIAAKYAEKSATSYEYFASPLIEPAEGDPLSSLSASLTPIKALEGPKTKK